MGGTFYSATIFRYRITWVTPDCHATQIGPNPINFPLAPRLQLWRAGEGGARQAEGMGGERL